MAVSWQTFGISSVQGIRFWGNEILVWLDKDLLVHGLFPVLALNGSFAPSPAFKVGPSLGSHAVFPKAAEAVAI